MPPAAIFASRSILIRLPLEASFFHEAMCRRERVSAMMHEQKDHFYREAKREGYRSRAAYKLIEINKRHRILHKGDGVLDCGAAPGSWLQVALRQVGGNGIVVGIDLKKVVPFPDTGNLYLHTCDINAISSGDLRSSLYGCEDLLDFC